jgi:hypothetical protein
MLKKRESNVILPDRMQYKDVQMILGERGSCVWRLDWTKVDRLSSIRYP